MGFSVVYGFRVLLLRTFGVRRAWSEVFSLGVGKFLSKILLRFITFLLSAGGVKTDLCSAFGVLVSILIWFLGLSIWEKYSFKSMFSIGTSGIPLILGVLPPRYLFDPNCFFMFNSKVLILAWFSANSCIITYWRLLLSSEGLFFGKNISISRWSEYSSFSIFKCFSSSAPGVVGDRSRSSSTAWQWIWETLTFCSFLTTVLVVVSGDILPKTLTLLTGGSFMILNYFEILGETFLGEPSLYEKLLFYKSAVSTVFIGPSNSEFFTKIFKGSFSILNLEGWINFLPIINIGTSYFGFGFGN